MDKKIRDQYELVKAMDTIARMLNNEDGIEIWLQEGPGDGSTDEDYWYCAEDDDLMDSIVDAFVEAIEIAGGDGFAVGEFCGHGDLRQCGGKRG